MSRFGSSFASASRGGLDQTSEAEIISQKKALDELLGVLLSAGYFRARIPQLTAFDKVSDIVQGTFNLHNVS